MRIVDSRREHLDWMHDHWADHVLTVEGSGWEASTRTNDRSPIPTGSSVVRFDELPR
jgi:hypothetical protein